MQRGMRNMLSCMKSMQMGRRSMQRRMGSVHWCKRSMHRNRRREEDSALKK